MDAKASWQFDEREVAEWFRDVAAKYYYARCPSCEQKDMLGLQVSVGILTEVIVSCGFFDCDFAKRIVRSADRYGAPLVVAQEGYQWTLASE